MARPSSHPKELRDGIGHQGAHHPCVERAVALVTGSEGDYASEFEAIKSIATELGIGSAETLRKWVPPCRGRR